METASTPTTATTSANAVNTGKEEDGDRKLPALASASAPPHEEELEEKEGSNRAVEEEKNDFVFDGAPDGMKCSVGFCLMTEAVMAMDGFSYQKLSLDKYITHCTAKGQPLTSPLIGERVGEMPNHNLRTLVKDYIEEREKSGGSMWRSGERDGEANETSGTEKTEM